MDAPTILVIGHFASGGRPNGQTERTVAVAKTLRKYLAGHEIIQFDTANMLSARTFRLASLIRKADRIVILPARRAIHPLLLIIRALGAQGKTAHVAIGGWLDEKIASKPYLQIERETLGVLVQTRTLRERLLGMGLSNAVLFPNYRDITAETRRRADTHDARHKLVCYSRVMAEKGIAEAVEAVRMLSDAGESVSLTIYGPVVDAYEEAFSAMRAGFPPYITYGGVLVSGEIIETLRQYELLLFPTYYIGEGFPGTLLEALIAGVPVVASDWKYNREIIEEHGVGLLCGTRSSLALCESVRELLGKPQLIALMRRNCIEAGKAYSEERVTPILLNALGIGGSSSPV